MAKKKKSVKYFKIALAFILLLFLIRLGQQAYTLYRVKQETSKTEARVEELKKENETLEQEKKNLGDIKYVEKIAREEHNMVGKNEIPIFIVDDKKTDNDASKAQEKNK